MAARKALLGVLSDDDLVDINSLSSTALTCAREHKMSTAAVVKILEKYSTEDIRAEIESINCLKDAVRALSVRFLVDKDLKSAILFPDGEDTQGEDENALLTSQGDDPDDGASTVSTCIRIQSRHPPSDDTSTSGTKLDQHSTPALHDASTPVSFSAVSNDLSKLIEVITDLKKQLDEDRTAARDREYRLQRKVHDLTNQIEQLKNNCVESERRLTKQLHDFKSRVSNGTGSNAKNNRKKPATTRNLNEKQEINEDTSTHERTASDNIVQPAEQKNPHRKTH